MSKPMSKKPIQIVVRVVDRPAIEKPDSNKPYQPPKAAVFKSIATCEINGKRYSKTATDSSEEVSRTSAFSKLATLVAKQGAVPIPGPGVPASAVIQSPENT